jgi:hypothetical protein
MIRKAEVSGVGGAIPTRGRRRVDVTLDRGRRIRIGGRYVSVAWLIRVGVTRVKAGAIVAAIRNRRATTRACQSDQRRQLRHRGAS